MVYGSLKNAVDAYAAECTTHGRAPRQSSCSYFIHIAGDAQEESYGRETLIRYFKDALIGSFPSDAKTVPPSLAYFIDIVKILDNMRPEDLTAKSVLIGSPEKIIADLRGGRSLGDQRGHLVLQLRDEAARHGEGSDAALRARHRAGVRLGGQRSAFW